MRGLGIRLSPGGLIQAIAWIGERSWSRGAQPGGVLRRCHRSPPAEPSGRAQPLRGGPLDLTLGLASVIPDAIVGFIDKHLRRH